jgi:23S rRNA (uridine2552-2'-O)-methyltransferase
MFKVKDHYYQKAKDENYLARSIYKLEEIDQRFKILKKGDLVVDLGYFPGSWAQYTAPKVGPTGKVVGIDIQPVNKKLQLPNLVLFEKDIFELKSPADLGVERPFDVVLSDMAPKTTGIKTVDQARSLDLIESVFGMLPILLRPNGNFVIKVFESNDAQIFLKAQKEKFADFQYLRPKSTRSVSKEFFVIGKGFKA